MSDNVCVRPLIFRLVVKTRANEGTPFTSIPLTTWRRNPATVMTESHSPRDRPFLVACSFLCRKDFFKYISTSNIVSRRLMKNPVYLASRFWYMFYSTIWNILNVLFLIFHQEFWRDNGRYGAMKDLQDKQILSILSNSIWLAQARDKNGVRAFVNTLCFSENP